MAKFEVNVTRVREVEAHPNADRLEKAVVADFRVVVPKGAYQPGDKVVYIPEGAVVPDTILAEMGLVGKLAGSKGNRVKPMKLRGELSEGLVYKADPAFAEGQDVASLLGIVKYEPVIPPSMAGEVYGLDTDEVVAFDIENIKKFPEAFVPGEPVVFTEKLHGTFTMVGARPANDPREVFGHDQNRFFVSSKGMMGDRRGLRHHVEANARNLYLRVAEDRGIKRVAGELADRFGQNTFILGETFGAGIQDLGYGFVSTSPGFRLFAIVVGRRYLNDAEIEAVIAEFPHLERVPVLYRGPFSVAKVREFTDGVETISGEGKHIREGIIITPAQERQGPSEGRLILKSISDAYHDRKNGTDFT